MAGILNSKSRVIDAILTVEGRRRMAEGSYSIAYATFTDEGVSYIPDPIAGHGDPTGKIYLEARNLPQDTITFTANDDGRVLPFRNTTPTLSNEGGSVPGTTSPANLINGNLEVYSISHGYSITFGDIEENPSDSGKGFTYSDSGGVTGSILISSQLLGGTWEITGSPNPIGRIGTRGGLGSHQFASTVSRVISLLSSSSGPKVNPNPQFGTLYVEPAGGSLTGSILTPIGELSTRLILTPPAVGGRVVSGEIDSPSFASQIEGVLTSSLDNFGKNFTLSSVDRIFGDENFTLSRESITFDLSRISSPILTTLNSSPPPLNGIPSLFQDEKFSHLPNFAYLPPIVKVSESRVGDKSKLENLTGYLLGGYPSWGENESELTFPQLQREVNLFDPTEQPIRIVESSRGNRILSQFFEISNGRVSKLDVIERGNMDGRTVFFIGKTFLDNRGTTTFVNLFTLIFSPLTGERDLLT